MTMSFSLEQCDADSRLARPVSRADLLCRDLVCNLRRSQYDRSRHASEGCTLQSKASSTHTRHQFVSARWKAESQQLYESYAESGAGVMTSEDTRAQLTGR